MSDNILEAARCRALWSNVILTAMSVDAVLPFTILKHEKSKDFEHQFKLMLKRDRNPFKFENKYGGSARTGIDRKHARSWLLGKSQEFIEVCQLAGVDNWQAIEKKAREMIAVVDDYEKKYREIKEHE